MADPVILDSAAIWYGGYDITGSLNEAHFSLMRNQNTDARFTDTTEAFFPGRYSADVSVNGFYDSATDAIVEPRIGSDRTAWPLTLAPPSAPNATAGADGNIAYTILVSQYSYELNGKHGDSLPYSFKAMAHSLGTPGAVSRQTVMLPKASVSSTTTGTGRQLGAISSTQYMVATLHVFSVTGGTWTLTVESDDNSGFTTPITRATFTGATGITRQLIATAGSIADDWWRVVLTKSSGTSCIAAALLGIV